jgi:hypothetical protein
MVELQFASDLMAEALANLEGIEIAINQRRSTLSEANCFEL